MLVGTDRDAWLSDVELRRRIANGDTTVFGETDAHQLHRYRTYVEYYRAVKRLPVGICEDHQLATQLRCKHAGKVRAATHAIRDALVGRLLAAMHVRFNGVLDRMLLRMYDVVPCDGGGGNDPSEGQPPRPTHVLKCKVSATTDRQHFTTLGSSSGLSKTDAMMLPPSDAELRASELLRYFHVSCDDERDTILAALLARAMKRFVATYTVIADDAPYDYTRTRRMCIANLIGYPRGDPHASRIKNANYPHIEYTCVDKVPLWNGRNK